MSYNDQAIFKLIQEVDHNTQLIESLEKIIEHLRQIIYDLEEDIKILYRRLEGLPISPFEDE